MCKQTMLRDYLQKTQSKFDRIFYLGDGKNDFCPLKMLQKEDVAFVRKNLDLHKMIEKLKAKGKFDLKCEIFFWDNGFDILNHINS